MNFFKKIAREIGRAAYKAEDYLGGIPVIGQSLTSIAAVGRSVGGKFSGTKESELWQQAAISQGQLLSQVASYYTGGVSGLLTGALSGSAYNVSAGSKAITIAQSLLSGKNPAQVVSGGDSLAGNLASFLNVPGVAATAGIQEKLVTLGETYSFGKALASTVLGGLFGKKKKTPVLPATPVYRAASGAVYDLDSITKYLGMGTGKAAWDSLTRLLQVQAKQSGASSTGSLPLQAKPSAPSPVQSSMQVLNSAGVPLSALSSEQQQQVLNLVNLLPTSVAKSLVTEKPVSPISSTSGPSVKPSVSPSSSRKGIAPGVGVR